MDYDEFMDEQNPFDGMDYHEILDWASEHESELEAYGIDPSTIGEYLKNDFDGGKFSQVDTERFQMYSGEQVISHLMQCTPDVTYQAVQTFFIPFLLSLSVQLISRSGISVNLRHGFCIATGLAMICEFHSISLCLFSAAFSLLWLNLASLSPQKSIYLLPISILCCEYFIGSTWSYLRGPMLIFVLKYLSILLSQDYELDLDDTNQVLEILGYFYHPATLMFGPWIPLNWYISSIEDPKASIRSLLLIVPALFFLVCSTCVASVLPPGAITDTYSFHFSHYYILFATEVMIAVSGIMPINSFCNPVKILLPFEMHDVCRSWNRPIHQFLREYIFIPLKKQYHTFFAIMGTFAISAVLHGLNFPIFVTLITLGLVSYAEFEFRRKIGIYFKLPNILPSSHRLRFEAKLHKDPPLRRNSDKSEISQVSEISSPIQEVQKMNFIERALDSIFIFFNSKILAFKNYLCNTGLELFINVLFLIMNIIHLIYLGSTFENSDMSFHETIQKFENFYYISPIMTGITLFYGHLL